VLLGLLQGPAHGYSLLHTLEAYDLGQLDPSVVYRVLRDMEANGWVQSTWDEQATQGPPRRVYELTDLGRESLAEWAEELALTSARIEKFLAEYETSKRKSR